MARVSAIIPTYNRANLVVEAINAVQSQTVPVSEIIVVDDGSTDNTQAAVAAISGPVQCFRQENSGKSTALNVGLSKCTGDYVWICDDDDVALPGAIESLLNALEDTDAGFAFGRYCRFVEDPQSGRRKILSEENWPNFTENSILLNLLEDCFICQNASLVRRSAYDAVGAFRPDLIRSQDYEMAIRLARHFKAIYVPEVMFLQRTHEGERGSAGDRFDSTKQFAKWLHYDAIFFRELYDTIPLSMLVPNGIPDSSEEIGYRAALLQRACIFARKKLWQLSLSDLDKAVRMNPHTPLTGVESRICRRFLVSKFGCDELVTDPEIARTLCAISDTGDVARAVIVSVTAPLLWHARHALTSGELGLSKGFVAILARVYGYQEIATMLLSAVRRRIFSAG